MDNKKKPTTKSVAKKPVAKTVVKPTAKPVEKPATITPVLRRRGGGTIG
ncbi:MAG: hypothetical protein WC998_05150 [Candidatus Paceibacterota bacterium]|jgi:hypothetical protein